MTTIDGHTEPFESCHDCRKQVLRAIFFPLFVFIVAFTILRISAQDKPPQLSADSRISLLKLQLKQKQLESQFLQMQQELNRIQGQYNDGVKALQDAIEASYKEAKLDKKEWMLNLDTLEFTKIPAPPKPQEPKKP